MSKPRLAVRLASIAILFMILAIILEASARIFFAMKDALRSRSLVVEAIDPSVLDEYEIQDPQQPWNWRPKPGYSATIDRIIAAKRKGNKILAEELLEDTVQKFSAPRDRVVMRINDDGFKGPDIDKAHTRLRILTIGDSCTFGTMFDEYSYPRVLERELAHLGRQVEVINGGVEGYGPANVLARIDEYKLLNPEITTIYIGWNALYAEPESHGVEHYFKSVRLFRKAYGKLEEKIYGRTQMALQAYGKPKHVQRDAYEVRALEGFEPTFMTDLETIVKEMRKAGSEVVLITLPGLFLMDEEPSQKALAVGHLPTFTDNPYVLAKMSAEYNMRLRRLAKNQGLLVIDLEEWSRDSLKPRDKFFFDSVHLYEEGQERIGRYLAQQLLPIVNANGKTIHTNVTDDIMVASP
jgi:lysophospholipase L1-like esterase